MFILFQNRDFLFFSFFFLLGKELEISILDKTKQKSSRR
jgi:hypothetical protein